MLESSWTIGVQVSTAHTPLEQLPTSFVEATLESALANVPIDIVAVGTREAPDIFPLVCELGRRRGYKSYLWYNLLSDVVGSEPSDLVVDWRGRSSTGWGSWDGRDGAAHETFRFICPNNPSARRKTLDQIERLLVRYPFDGVFLDKCRFPSPANGIEEVFSCFCAHCRKAAAASGLELEKVASMLENGLLQEQLKTDDIEAMIGGIWTSRLIDTESLLGRFMRFRESSVTALIVEAKALAQRLGRTLAVDLFTAGLAPIVGQNYRAIADLATWAKPMTYRRALGPASLRLEVPALFDGLERLSGKPKALLESWATQHVRGFTPGLLAAAVDDAVPISLMGAEIGAAVEHMGNVPVYAGIETLSYPGVIDIKPQMVKEMVQAARSNGALGAIASWDLIYTPEENLLALRADA